MSKLPNEFGYASLQTPLHAASQPQPPRRNPSWPLHLMNGYVCSPDTPEMACLPPLPGPRAYGSPELGHHATIVSCTSVAASIKPSKTPNLMHEFAISYSSVYPFVSAMVPVLGPDLIAVAWRRDCCLHMPTRRYALDGCSATAGSLRLKAQ